MKEQLEKIRQEALDALSAQSGADPADRLDVLAEQRLIVFEQHPKSVHITLCPNGRKVDLTQSGILIHLKEQKAGK